MQNNLKKIIHEQNANILRDSYSSREQIERKIVTYKLETIINYIEALELNIENRLLAIEAAVGLEKPIKKRGKK